MKGKKGVTVENRRRILRLIENMTMGRTLSESRRVKLGRVTPSATAMAMSVREPNLGTCEERGGIFELLGLKRLLPPKAA